MSEMLERVKSAILSTLNNRTGSNKEVADSAAALVLQVMLEPTQEMIEAVERYSPNEADPMFYAVMVEAALGRPERPSGIEFGPERPAGTADQYGVPRAKE